MPELSSKSRGKRPMSELASAGSSGLPPPPAAAPPQRLPSSRASDDRSGMASPTGSLSDGIAAYATDNRRRLGEEVSTVDEDALRTEMISR